MYKQKKYAASYSLYTRIGATQGSDAIAGISFAKWAYFDNGNNFQKDFEEVHGANSFARFQEEWDLCLDQTATFDELLEWMNDLTG